MGSIPTAECCRISLLSRHSLLRHILLLLLLIIIIIVTVVTVVVVDQVLAGAVERERRERRGDRPHTRAPVITGALTTKAADAAGWDRRPKDHVRATAPPRRRDRRAHGQRVAPVGWRRWRRMRQSKRSRKVRQWMQ
jgi:hypothetical protein